MSIEPIEIRDDIIHGQLVKVKVYACGQGTINHELKTVFGTIRVNLEGDPLESLVEEYQEKQSLLDDPEELF